MTATLPDLLKSYREGGAFPSYDQLAAIADKDQGGAAVRGEAVAEPSEEMIAAAIEEFDKVSSLPEYGWKDAVELALVAGLKARAADAPSEPSESIMRAALERIARWHGEFPDTGKTWPTGGAVSYAAEYGSNGERDYMRQVSLDALKSRVADALDSQPTESTKDTK